HKLCQLFFKLYVDMQGAIQKPRPATSGTELANGGNGGFFYLRMVGQIQVIIGAEHEDLTIAQHDFTVATAIAGAKNLEIEIESSLLQSTGAVEIPALLENIGAIRPAGVGGRNFFHLIQLLKTNAHLLARLGLWQIKPFRPPE